MRIRGILLRVAMLVYLLTSAPVLAMAEIERREMHRPALVQTIAIRGGGAIMRRRALDRRYGSPTVIYRFLA